MKVRGLLIKGIDAPKPLPPHIVDVDAETDGDCLVNVDYPNRKEDYLLNRIRRITSKRFTQNLIMSGDHNTHNHQQPHINYAGQKVDLDKYADIRGWCHIQSQ